MQKPVSDSLENAPAEPQADEARLSPRWRYGALLVFIVGLIILVYLSTIAYRDAPPIPKTVVDQQGRTLFTAADIQAGQQVFLKYGLMQHGSIWGHGAYMGPDYTAEYLHVLAIQANEQMAPRMFGKTLPKLTDANKAAVNAEVRQLLQVNRYDPDNGVLVFTDAEKASYRNQIERWEAYLASGPAATAGLPAGFIGKRDPVENLTAFFAWTAWASVARRPGKTFSYTNNFPYDRLAGNTLSRDAILWSALSVIMLLAGLAAVLFVFGKFDYLGWKGEHNRTHPQMLPGETTSSQRAIVKFFVIVSLLFLAQTLVGGALAHFRADPGSFYGIDLTRIFSSNVLRTWHVQLALFWIATSFVAGGLLLSSTLGDKEPRGQAAGIHLLFWTLVIVVVGSLLGELFGIRQRFGEYWSIFGDQGWEYLDLGRIWQILLVVGLLLWLFLLYRNIRDTKRDPRRREVIFLFLGGAVAIPFFYLPAFFFNSATNYSIVDIWRFWIIHLWVEGFFELFVTVMVAVTFFQLGVVSRITATRIIYLDAIIFLAGGMVGTAHHWYWTGQSNITMAFAALFSALEVVPLTLLTLDAWDFIRLTGAKGEAEGKGLVVPHKWAFYFLRAVGFWNFVGAGIFGFLINMPMVSYFEAGTMLTPNHGHAALMGAFGMLALALMILTLRQVLTDEQWEKPEKFIKVSFWGLNIGLALMVLTNLLPGGVMQLWDVIENGYWHARSIAYMGNEHVRLLEWLRMPADMIFILLGALPVAIAALLTYKYIRFSGGSEASRQSVEE
ncbi:MAG: cbb3-type cytochrome c oxidase subunit I [Desulfobacterales bacterium]